jgi:nucleoside-diphosphate-sugar epimerase
MTSTHHAPALQNCKDPYSLSKALAEQMVLQANGAALRIQQPSNAETKGGFGGGVLRTCALRPAGLYCADEERHLPRIFNMAGKGLLMFTFGNPASLTDWVHTGRWWVKQQP